MKKKKGKIVEMKTSMSPEVARHISATKEKHPKFHKYKTVPLFRLLPSEYNPNEMDPNEFALLVDNMEKEGFLEPLLVARHRDPELPDVRYRVVGGHHRLEASKVCGYERVPIIITDMDSDTQKKQIVRMNKIRGSFNIFKFNELVNDLVSRGVMTDDDAAFQMGFADPDEFALIRESFRETLPDSKSKREFDKKAKNAKTVDDLYSIVMQLMKRYGDTLPANFMIIALGTNRNLWVQLDGRYIRDFERKARDCLDKGITFDSFILEVLKATDAEEFIEDNSDKLVRIEGEEVQEIDDFFTDEPGVEEFA